MGIHDYWEDGEAPDWGDDHDREENPDWVEGQREVELVFDLLVHTSEKAYLLQFDEKNVRLPKSIATLNMSMYKNTVQIPKWLMIEKELEDYCTDESVVQEKTETEKLFNKVVRKNICKLKDDIPF